MWMTKRYKVFLLLSISSQRQGFGNRKFKKDNLNATSLNLGWQSCSALLWCEEGLPSWPGAQWLWYCRCLIDWPGGQKGFYISISMADIFSLQMEQSLALVWTKFKLYTEYGLKLMNWKLSSLFNQKLVQSSVYQPGNKIVEWHALKFIEFSSRTVNIL
jgi:hypothetical protein